VTDPLARGVIHDAVREELDVAALSDRYGAMVLRRCWQLLRDQDEALDACQDVFVRLIEQRRRLDGRFPSSLLYTIATNVCLNRIRDRTRAGRASGGDSDRDRLEAIACAEPPGGDSDARMLLDWLFGRHPPSSRTIAVLHYVDGLTLDQVAAETGLSVSGVRKRLRRLRETLVSLKSDV
jgi:RNA polymerase sigma-70 factor, ECF subfamily